jgi:cytochrome c
VNVAVKIPSGYCGFVNYRYDAACKKYCKSDINLTVIQGDSMKVLLSTIAAATMLLAGHVNAADAEAAKALAQKSGCLACHSIDKKVLGPSYKDIAAKYKGDKTAEAKLIEKVKKGGSGVWGPMPMPANSPQVKDADIKTIVQWVLTL